MTTRSSGKRKAHTIGPGRPRRTMGMGASAPRLNVALDAETEAAMLALSRDCKGTVAPPDLARDAIRAYAADRCPAAVAQCLEQVTKRRESER